MKMNLKRFYNRPAVVDASVLFDFYELNSLHILNLVFSELYIPLELMAEITGDKQLNEIKRQVDYIEVFIETAKAYELFVKLGQTWKQLSVYDRHRICTAYEKGFLCASNDKLVARVCGELKMDNPRTLGILGCAFLFKIIDQPELEKLFFLLVSEACSCHLTLNDTASREFAEMFNINIAIEQKNKNL
ncbi:MAG: hypothetical protein VR68_03570 [Peptococcaceae bacterium BRH_c4a]|nr:MAG: hypothetical protein VR68_03570 [Peptococcaceae bacterium BRH_c4a]